jgi:hypothetical protein
MSSLSIEFKEVCVTFVGLLCMYFEKSIWALDKIFLLLHL